MQSFLVQDFLEKSAARLGEKVALVCDEQRLTYAQIDQTANRIANGLINLGVNRGDRVIIHLANSVELVIAIFAVLKANATFVIVNATTKDDKLGYIIDDCWAKACITWSSRASAIAAMIPALPSLKFAVIVSADSDPPDSAGLVDYQSLIADQTSVCPVRECIDLDLACLIYTSGSTGEPKGVMSDHSNMVFAANSIVSYVENDEHDIIINVLPLSFDYGLYQLLMAFSVGARLVLEKGFAFPAKVLKQIASERVTGFPGVPTIFSVMLNLDLSPYDLSSLKYMTNTAAALPPSHIQKIREQFPDVRLYSMYGLTETKRTLYLPPEELDRRPGSVGIAIPGTEVWIEDDDGNRLGPGQSGELVVRGRHVMRGYWGDERATAERYRPGEYPGERYCYTGDLFRKDEDGYLYFVSRKDDIIKSRGEKVSPKEVEEVLYQLQGVREAAVIGVPDPVLGETVKAIIVQDGNLLSEIDVKRHCRDYLEDFMVPRQIEFVTELPKTSSGKIKKTGLR